ncbi:hypothetical protein MP228_005685 [Amoeboaphelidium protococcarum]|nr:hypothetical protein MP228_005685 [Amoeboaphelidium protococcarum]
MPVKKQSPACYICSMDKIKMDSIHIIQLCQAEDCLAWFPQTLAPLLSQEGPGADATFAVRLVAVSLAASLLGCFRALNVVVSAGLQIKFNLGSFITWCLVLAGVGLKSGGSGGWLVGGGKQRSVGLVVKNCMLEKGLAVRRYAGRGPLLTIKFGPHRKFSQTRESPRQPKAA